MTPAELARLDQASAQADRDALRTAAGLGRLLHVLVILAGMVLAQVPAAIWPGTALAVLGLIGGVAVMVWSALHIIGVLGATEVPRS